MSPPTRRACSTASKIPRRRLLQLGFCGGLGLSLTDLLALRARTASVETPELQSGRARSAIVLFAWGGLSHIDTWDMKPEAGSDIRGEYLPIETSAPGIRFCEHLPRLARQAHRMTLVRSVHHGSADHRMAAYWNLTGHRPAGLSAGGVVSPVPPSRQDWPCLGSMVARAKAERRREITQALPGAVTLPYPIADRGLVNGQFAGFLGSAFDPVFAAPPAGRRYSGVSPQGGTIDLQPAPGTDRSRIDQRRTLLSGLESVAGPLGTGVEAKLLGEWRQKAFDMLLAPPVRSAFDLEQESEAVRRAYGDHICGQSVLLARRLSEAGVPLVTVNCAAGDLNGSAGAHFDTHGDNFNRLKRDMLPPLDRASAVLLDDLAERGKLDETLVVWLTEFGRTPKINGGAGRDHFPNCYCVAFAGAGVRGGTVYGRSDKTGSTPIDSACMPADLHATIFRTLGIDPTLQIADLEGRPFPLTDGHPLALR